MAQLLAAADVRLESRGRRADLVLAAPERRNAQTPLTWRALAAAAGWLAGRADVVVVRAEGPTFSAGLDRRAFTPEGIPGEFNVGELAALRDPDLDARIRQYQEGFAALADGPFLTIAAVQGHAVGGGFQLALACDLRLATADAQFCMREPAFGLVPDLAGTHPLVAAVGYARAVEICATARWVGADEALALGLVQGVVPVDRLEAATDDLVAAVAANVPAAVLATRDLLRGAARRAPAEQRAAERAAQLPRLRALAAGHR
ncbi:MAG TPA: enoyl-CoA hydratase/isomerase family protein [Kineosporiaceae bacterium]